MKQATIKEAIATGLGVFTGMIVGVAVSSYLFNGDGFGWHTIASFVTGFSLGVGGGTVGLVTYWLLADGEL